MGAGQSDLYKGTYGDNPDNIPDELKGKVKFPKNESQIKHIMRDDEGHLPDTKSNRERLLNLANDVQCHIGKDNRGIEWNAKINKDGTQDWVSHRNSIIQDGGVNKIFREFDIETGLKHNARTSTSWRKKNDKC